MIYVIIAIAVLNTIFNGRLALRYIKDSPNIPGLLVFASWACVPAAIALTNPLIHQLLVAVGAVALLYPLILMVIDRHVEKPAAIQAPPEPVVEPKVHPQLPDDLRTSHTVIVSLSGHGKTQLLQSLILDDIDKDQTVVVLDSQTHLIRNLLNVVPANRLTYLTPTDTDYPLALNLFEKGQDPELFEYIFSALDADMTSKQAMLYRYLARLVSAIPGGNIATMQELLERGGTGKYHAELSTLPPTVQAFFQNEFNTRQYEETKQQIGRRLYTLLENDSFRAMFTAKEMKLNLAQEMGEGRVILIDASKRVLKGSAFKIFGRFFIAQIARAIFEREHPYAKRVSIYIDEFQEYAREEEFVEELFTQARKYNVALTVAFQFLDQLPVAVRAAILSNTIIKMVGETSSADRRAMANEIGVPHENLALLHKGTFMTKAGQQRFGFKVPFGRLEAEGQRTKKELNLIRDAMRQRYATSEDDIVPEPLPKGADPFADEPT
ncbi:type IV secretion system DNA-binding domain-containing protein [Tsuneonella sp. HG222]